jgi:TolB-like protein/Flp pilus assembly protein TadD
MATAASGDIALFEDFRLDRRAGVLFQRDQQGAFVPVAIGRRALDILSVLVEHPGDLVARDEIIKAAWRGRAVEESNLNVQVAALRRILDRDRDQGSCIQTVAGRGYRFVTPVARCKCDAHSVSEAIEQRGSRVPPRLSIIVLPFTNLSDDRDQQYFADGITEDLTTDLSRLAGSLVISANTAFTYKGRPRETRQIGRELSVRYVLEGSVQRFGNRVRINAQLIDADIDAHLWAERFDRDIGDLFAVQNEITGRIAVALNFALTGAEAARPTANPEALDYVFRGRAVASKPPTRDSTVERIRFFEQALALDPESAEVQIRLAFSLTGRVLLGMSRTAAADLARAEALIQRAMAVSSNFPLAYWAKGQLLRAQCRYAEAVPEYETAIALDRNLPGAYGNLGQTKLLTGALEEVIPLLEQAIRLSPRDPDLGYWYDIIGLTHLLQSRTDQAIAWFEKACSASPARPLPRVSLAAAYGLIGNSEGAAAELAEARRLSGNPATLFTIAGRRAGSGRDFMAPKVRALFEATYDVGLRKAGMPDD